MKGLDKKKNLASVLSMTAKTTNHGAQNRALADKIRKVAAMLDEIAGELDLGELNDLTAEVRERWAKFQAEKRCLFCSEPLGKERVKRGCHVNCYGRMAAWIRNGKTTESELMAKGLIGLSPTPGRKPKRGVRSAQQIKQLNPTSDELPEVGEDAIADAEEMRSSVQGVRKIKNAKSRK